MGEWQLNNRILTIHRPLAARKNITLRGWERVRYTSALGVSVQHYDGKHFPKAAPSDHTRRLREHL